MNERGTVTLWLLGLCVCLLFLGGLSVDLWRVANARHELAGLADSAAIEAAGALDEAAFRTQGVVRLDAVAARRRAAGHLADRLPAGTSTAMAVSADRVTVSLQRRVRLSLLAVLLPDEEVVVAARSTVDPVQAR